MPKLTLVLLDEDGKELGRRGYGFASEPEQGPPRGPVEYQTGVKAMELYRDCFWTVRVPH